MAPTRRRRWPAALLLLAWPLQACGGGTTVRVRVPLEQNPEGALAAERCVLYCRSHWAPATSQYVECLAGGPGAEVDSGEQCAASDRAPRAVCVNSLHDPDAEITQSDEPTRDVGAAEAVGTGLAVASLLLDLATIGSKKGKGGGKSRGHHSGSHSSGSHSSGSRSSGSHSSGSHSSGSHASASPSKGSSGHVSAKPSAN
jgi:hypothetical protein